MKTKHKIIVTLALALTVWQPLSALADRIPTTPTVISSKDVAYTGTIWGTSLDYTGYDVVGGTGYTDYGNAPSSYGIVGGDKGQDQGLGLKNGTNDGVLWSVGGSDFGTTADLVIGQDVTFKFLFWQANYGIHALDQIFAAFDFNQNGVFDDPSDTILDEDVLKVGTVTDNTSRTNSRYYEFTLTFTVPETMTVGSTWLRARSTCNDANLNAIVSTPNQNEIEDYQLNIVRQNNPVPEPATMLLFGFGLAGLSGLRARRKK